MADIKIHLDESDKDEIIAPEERANASAKKQWYAQRCTMVGNIDNINVADHTEKEFLKAVLGMLTKIYWELRKPKPR